MVRSLQAQQRRQVRPQAGRPARRQIAYALLLGVVVALAPTGFGRAARAGGDERPAALVEITDLLRFEPAEVEVSPGDVVEWQSVSLLVHTVTADPARATLEGSVELPAGASPFDSGNIEPQGVFRHRFTTPGTYRYFCVPHEGIPMRGTIVVREPGKQGGAKTRSR